MNKTLVIDFDGNSAAIKVKISITVLQSGFKIHKQNFIDSDGGSGLQLTVVQGEKPLSELIDALKAVPEVTDVQEDSQAVDTAIEQAGNQLEPIVAAVAKAYPNFMGVVRDYEQTLPEEIRGQMLNAVGQGAGTQIYNTHLAKIKYEPTVPLILEQIVLRAIKPFAIARTSGSQLELSVCPFSVNPVSPKGIDCEFLSGFLRGLFANIPDAPKVSINKTHCKARGEGRCAFHTSN